MTAIERTAYPRFKEQLTLAELEQVYRPTPSEQAFVRANANGTGPQLTFLIMLKGFQNLGYFPNIADVPQHIINYLRECQAYPPDTLPSTNVATLARYRRLIRDRLAISRYEDGGEETAPAPSQMECFRLL